MIEIKPSDLQPNQTYYIDRTNTIPHMLIARWKKTGGLRLKTILNKIVPYDGSNQEYAIFYKYTDVNSSNVDYFNGCFYFMNFRSYKYYLPTRDYILKEKEKFMVNSILQQITGDPCFKYYL
jgi:hypothetical protein